jgi:hypothetical protein
MSSRIIAQFRLARFSLMTACGRRMNQAKEAATKKATALAAAITQAEGIATDRGGLTDELKAALAKRADEVFGAAKK